MRGVYVQEHVRRTWPEKENAHLAELDPRWLEVMLVNGALPRRLSGENFLVMYPEGHGDDVTSIDRRVTYDMATCGSHPVMEHRRVAPSASGSPRSPTTRPSPNS